MHKILIPLITLGLFAWLAVYSQSEPRYDIDGMNKLAGESKQSTLVERQARALDDVYGVTKP